MKKNGGEGNLKKAKELQEKIKNLEPEVESLFEFLRDNFQPELKEEWFYLAERRDTEALNLRDKYQSLAGSINYIVNTCGVDINIHKEE